MTKEEIKMLLNDTKVYVNGKSKEIQEKLFSFGYEWSRGNTPKEVRCIKSPFLFIFKSGYIRCGDDMYFFKEHENKEITAEEILSLKITESSYRPFKNKDECWHEMQKHSPFGWLYRKEDNSYAPLIIAIENVTTNFAALFNHYCFADGTPFGIKDS